MESKFKETSRIEAFSDGVFAIAITLLVLELIQAFHPDPGESLLLSLSHHWEYFLAFSIGFITILVCWINHHIALEYVIKVDTQFMWINGFLLFLVTLTPFPTALLAEYLEKDGRTAVAIYGFNYVLISIAADRICSYAYHHNLIEGKHRDYYYSYKRIYRYAIIYTIIAFCLCWVSIIIPILLYILLFAAFALPKKFESILHHAGKKKKEGLLKKQSRHLSE